MCLVVFVVGAAATFTVEIVTDLALWWKYIVPNSCLAFVMNVTVSLVIKESSTFAFVLAGLVKAFAVVLRAIIFVETVMGQ